MRVILIFILFACVCSVISGKNEDTFPKDSEEAENDDLVIEAKQDIRKILKKIATGARSEDGTLAPSYNLNEPNPFDNKNINRAERQLTQLASGLKETNEFNKHNSKHDLRHDWAAENNRLRNMARNVVDETFKQQTRAAFDLLMHNIEKKLTEQQQLALRHSQNKGLHEYNNRHSKHILRLDNAPTGITHIRNMAIDPTSKQRITDAVEHMLENMDKNLKEKQQLRQRHSQNYKRTRASMSDYPHSKLAVNKYEILDELMKKVMESHNPHRVESMRTKKFKPIDYNARLSSKANESEVIQNYGTGTSNDLAKYLAKYHNVNKSRRIKREMQTDKLNLNNDNESNQPAAYLRSDDKDKIDTERQMNNNYFKEESYAAISENKPSVRQGDTDIMILTKGNVAQRLENQQEHNNETPKNRRRTSDNDNDDQVARYLNSRKNEKQGAQLTDYNDNYELGKKVLRQKDNLRKLLEKLYNAQMSKNNRANPINDFEGINTHIANDRKEKVAFQRHENSDVSTNHRVAEKAESGRQKRATQAGYTQDPDTCKTYNENLGKLWANLSHYINVTEQPDVQALHNIALMIQAYLEHQQNITLADSPTSNNGERSDLVYDVIIKIKTMFDEEEATPAQITKIITKYIKPYYGELKNDECQKTNEESLSSSIELLFKNYQENSKCENDDNDSDGFDERKTEILRKHSRSAPKRYPSNWRSNVARHNPVESLSIVTKNEFNGKHYKGKIFKFRPSKIRRIFKPIIILRSRKLPSKNRTEERNEDLNYDPKYRSKPKLKENRKKLKKTSLKTETVKDKCVKRAIRKFTMSLRPIIERFMGLLECQFDNTLRSEDIPQGVRIPLIHVYKIKSLRDNGPTVKIERIKKDRKKGNVKNRSSLIKRLGLSDKERKLRVGEENNDRNPLLRKYDLKHLRGTVIKAGNINENSKDVTSNRKIKSSLDDETAFNDFQSQSSYDDYDPLSRAETVNSYLPHALATPSPSLREQKNNAAATVNNKDTTVVSLRNNDFNIFNNDVLYDENNVKIQHFARDPDTYFEIDSEKVHKPMSQTPTVTKKTSYESIADFLKEARDVSMSTPEFAVPFALDTSKGYVEVTHLIKYPKTLVYRPQFLIKNTIPYEYFLKLVNNVNMTSDDVKLMKISRHLPDNTVKVLFETEDFESPLEVTNAKEKKAHQVPIVDIYGELQNRKDEVHVGDSNTILKEKSGGYDQIDLTRFTGADDDEPSGKLDLRKYSMNIPQSYNFLPDSSNVDPRLVPLLIPILPDEDAGSDFPKIDPRSTPILIPILPDEVTDSELENVDPTFIQVLSSVVSDRVTDIGSQIDSDTDSPTGSDIGTNTSTLDLYTQTAPPDTNSQTETGTTTLIPPFSINNTEKFHTTIQTQPVRRWWKEWKKSLMGQLKKEIKKIEGEIKTLNPDYVIELPRGRRSLISNT